LPGLSGFISFYFIPTISQRVYMSFDKVSSRIYVVYLFVLFLNDYLSQACFQKLIITLRIELFFSRWVIRPRILKNIAARNLSTSILGKGISFPIGIPPMGLQKLAHPDGELALARGRVYLQV